MAFMSLSALLLGLMLSEFLPDVGFLIYYCIAGFYMFRALVRKHVTSPAASSDQHRTDSISARYPFLTAWAGILLCQAILSVLGAVFFINPSADSATAIVQLLISAVANYFLFRFMIKRHIEPLAVDIQKVEIFSGEHNV